MRMVILMIALCTAGTAGAADDPECHIRVLHPVDDDMGNHRTAGKLVPVDILRRGDKGISYCAHGGACTPALVGGRHVVQLADCRPGKSIGNGDYRLDPDPSKMGAVRTRHFQAVRRVEDALSSLDFSNAAIATWSRTYSVNPASPDGRLVARALAGSTLALAAMKAKLP